ncbi:acetate kinase [Campylobacter cuniculorum]|uniref:Acetate kinase n=2 Tax=Campylobacter cuniculorum TaxID=374106 RepID=A0A1W6BWE3_9BACT|nr:acetate kinase [Campylobacter cuniculorum]ARJ56404.1 acetate kinase [Campylobacter cuniculorum DSM 23162 = LMG 24588]QOR03889.1 acetate kinase [Campylobacter cuniculorum]
MKILVLNSGSSSIKFKLFENQKAVCSGLVEKIGNHQSKIELKILKTGTKMRRDTHIGDHEKGLKLVNELFEESGILKDLNELDGCGHRIVHGGKNLTEHCLVNDFVLEEIHRVSSIAPLHNPAHLAGIKTMMKAAPKVPNATIFDTAFHKTIPDYAYMYALPYDYYTEYNIRKYGFHGTSHSYVSQRVAKLMGKKNEEINAISAHLGNGASVCAIENGKSIDTSMGFTPLEGLIMGTRCGDIDPATIPFIAKAKDLNPDKLDTMMNKQSGLYGICGYNDFRDIISEIQNGNNLARLAFEMYCYRLAKYIGSYFAILPYTDALIFTAGVGENAAAVRKLTCEKLKHLGIEIDEQLNEENSSGEKEISTKNSKTKIFVIPTDEELEIAKITESLIS